VLLLQVAVVVGSSSSSSKLPHELLVPFPNRGAQPLDGRVFFPRCQARVGDYGANQLLQAFLARDGSADVGLALVYHCLRQQ